MNFHAKVWLCVIGFAFFYCVGVNERENPISGMEMFQSNIYYYPVAFGLPATVPGTAVTHCSGDCIGNSIAYWSGYRIPNALANCIGMPCGSLLDVFFMTFGYLLGAFWYLLDASGEFFWSPGRLLAHFGPGVQKGAKKLEIGWTLVAPGGPNLRPFW